MIVIIIDKGDIDFHKILSFSKIDLLMYSTRNGLLVSSGFRSKDNKSF